MPDSFAPLACRALTAVCPCSIDHLLVGPAAWVEWAELEESAGQVVWVELVVLAGLVASAELENPVAWVESEELVAWVESEVREGVAGHRSFLPAAAHGNTIHHTAVARPMQTAEQRIALEGPHAGIHWRTGRQARDSRSTGRAATWPVLVMVAVLAAIAAAPAVVSVETVVAGAVLVAATESAAQVREAVAIA